MAVSSGQLPNPSLPPGLPLAAGVVALRVAGGEKQDRSTPILMHDSLSNRPVVLIDSGLIASGWPTALLRRTSLEWHELLALAARL